MNLKIDTSKPLPKSFFEQERPTISVKKALKGIRRMNWYERIVPEYKKRKRRKGFKSK